jgi:hypothetical protein
MLHFDVMCPARLPQELGRSYAGSGKTRLEPATIGLEGKMQPAAHQLLAADAMPMFHAEVRRRLGQ